MEPTKPRNSLDSTKATEVVPQRTGRDNPQSYHSAPRHLHRPSIRIPVQAGQILLPNRKKYPAPTRKVRGGNYRKQFLCLLWKKAGFANRRQSRKRFPRDCPASMLRPKPKGFVPTSLTCPEDSKSPLCGEKKCRTNPNWRSILRPKRTMVSNWRRFGWPPSRTPAPGFRFARRNPPRRFPRPYWKEKTEQTCCQAFRRHSQRKRTIHSLQNSSFGNSGCPFGNSSFPIGTDRRRMRLRTTVRA